MVCKSIVKKLTIPFATVSSTFLFTSFETAEAKSLDEFIKDGKVKNNPFYNEEAGSTVWENIGNSVMSAIDFFHNLKGNVSQMSLDLLAWIYQFITKIVLHTPTFIFSNSWIKDMTLTFSTISVSIVIILTMIESIKQMMSSQDVIKVSYTKFEDILKRLPIAIAGAGFAPILFQRTFEILNTLSKSITELGFHEISSDGAMSFTKWSGIDTVALLGFDILLIAMLFPVVIHNAKRWFDLLCLSALTPLSLTCWIFDKYKHFHNKWWSNVKSLSLVQLSYAFFIAIMGVFMFGTRDMTGGDAVLVKMLVILGGMWRMANPPSLVRGDSGNDIWETGKNVVDALTWRKFKPANFVKGKISAKKKAAEQLKETRKKLGRRYVK